MVRRHNRLLGLGSALLLTLVCTGTQAKADSVHFRYNGGRWSHGYRSGWHRYWGGPSIGFYYAPTPVYIVDGYDAPRYYSGPDYWYSNPSFGLSLDFGGGGYRRVDHYYYGGRNRYYGGRNYYSRSHFSGGSRYHGGHRR